MHVGTDTLDIGIRGDHETVAATWKRLVETFAGSHPLDPAPPVGVQIQAAPRDLTSRFGMTSLTLGAADILDVHMAHDPVSLLRHLDPAAGNVRAVVCTNFEELVGRHLPPPATPSPTLPTPSWLRLPMRSGGMRFPGGHAVISTVVPRTADGSAAIRVLLQQTAHHLSALTQRDDGVTASLIPVGPDVLATLLTSHDTLTPQQRSQIQQLLASRPIPDHRVHDAVKWEVAESPLSRTLERRVHGLPDDVDATIDGTHRALTLARGTLRFFTEEGSATPQGFEDIPPDLPAASEPRVSFKGPGGDRLTIGSDVIEHHRAGSRAAADVCDRVDLTRLELVVEDPADCLALVDNEFRVVEVIFDTYRNEQHLRELIAEKTAGVPRLTAHNAVHSEPARQRVKNRRTMMRWGMLTPIVVLGALAASSLFNNASSSGGESELELETHPHSVETEIGQTAMTHNGARITVEEVHQRPVDLGTEYTVALEYCAAAEHDVVYPGSVRLLYGQYARPATDVAATEDSLEVTQLTAGECTSGNAGFFVPEEDPSEIKIEYRAGDMGTLTWR